MAEFRSAFSVEAMSKLFAVSRSGFYDWLKRLSSEREISDRELLPVIREIFFSFGRNYGSPRVYKELRKHGHVVSRKRVEKLMKQAGLRAVPAHRSRPRTTDSNHGFQISPNRLERNFVTQRPNQTWVSDITYVWTTQGWAYLCVIVDLFSRKVVGWSLESHMRASMVVDALQMAVTNRCPGRGLIFHSDRGSQYASDKFRAALKMYGMQSSMSRKGDCWDNACAESFFATLKRELIRGRYFNSARAARSEIFRYIEGFYNKKRMHSFIGYLSPEEFETRESA